MFQIMDQKDSHYRESSQGVHYLDTGIFIDELFHRYLLSVDFVCFFVRAPYGYEPFVAFVLSDTKVMRLEKFSFMSAEKIRSP